MNTQRKRLYIVNFGDSRKYRYSFVETSESDMAHHSALFAKLEKDINDYLKEQFPDQTSAYYTKARFYEVDPSHEADYADYPVLDAKAVEEIKQQLVREIRDAEATKALNDNAPFADAPV